jgi:hypothetical protein
MKWPGFFAIAVLIAAGVPGNGTFAQSDQAPDLAAVRKTVDAARQEVDIHKKGGGAAGVAVHPAVKWDAELWAYRTRYPRSEAAAVASAEAVRLLVRAELWDRAHARIASLDADDPAWERVAAPVYEEGIARKDLPYAIDTLSRVANATTTPVIKASTLVTVGRAFRRSGDKAAAIRALESAQSAAPGTKYADEAEGLVYEIKYLSAGLPAPPVSGAARDGRTIDVAALRGKAVVLVFWGTT